MSRFFIADCIVDCKQYAIFTRTACSVLTAVYEIAKENLSC